MPNTASDGLAPSTFDPSLEYSTENVVVFWQPLSFFSQWSPSSFVVDDVSYSCAEQFTMAENPRLFRDHRAVELIMSSSDPNTHKRVGREVCNFDTPVWDREKKNALFSGNYAKLYAEPSHKKISFEHWQQLFCRGQSSRHSVGYRSPGGRPPRQGSTQVERNKFLGKALSAVCEEIRESKTGLPHPASTRRFRRPTGNAKIHDNSSAQQSRFGTAVRADQGPPSAFFSGTPADQSPEVLPIASRAASDRVLPEHCPCLVIVTMTLDDDSFTTDIAIHIGGEAIAPYRCTVLLDTGSPQTFI